MINKKNAKYSNKMGKVTKINIIFINLQLFLTFFTFGLFILYLVDVTQMYVFQFFLGISLLVMAYNNQVIYHRKKVTVLYVIVGIFLLILDVILFLGVR